MTAGLRTWWRGALIGTVLVLGGLTLLFLRGPDFWQRHYYPLEYRQQIASSSKRHSISPYLIAAVINVESGWDPAARSEAGAKGLMQVMPSTAVELAERDLVDAESFDPSDLQDPAVNIEYGAAYLRFLVERYHEVETALAAYNAGLANADAWSSGGGDIRERIEFPQTRNFVLKVARGKDRYEALYPEAFEGWTDGD